MAQVQMEMWHPDICSLGSDRLKDHALLEKTLSTILPKSLSEKTINLQSIKPYIVKRENRKPQINTSAGIIAMTETSLASLNESVEVPFTDAWGYEFSSRRELLSAEYPKSHRNCSFFYSKYLGRCRLKPLILIFFLTCFIIIISCMYYVTPASSDFDGTLGPHGGKPSDHSNMGLPVRLNNLTNHSTYFGMDFDWSIDDPQYINRILNIKNAIFGVKVILNVDMGDVLNLSGKVNSSGNITFLNL